MSRAYAFAIVMTSVLTLAACRNAPQASRIDVAPQQPVKIAAAIPAPVVIEAPKFASLPVPKVEKKPNRKPGVPLGLVLDTWADNDIRTRMNDEDRLKNQQAEKRIVIAPPGQMVTWKNPDSGNFGTIVAMRDAYDKNGTFCREIQQTVSLDGQQKQGRSVVCQQDDGSWRGQTL